MIFTYPPLLAALSLILAWLHAPSLWVFITAAAAIVPLAEWIRRATD
jgi:Ca2+:H+ antiporter